LENQLPLEITIPDKARASSFLVMVRYYLNQKGFTAKISNADAGGSQIIYVYKLVNKWL
jgi:hypothetical protein